MAAKVHQGSEHELDPAVKLHLLDRNRSPQAENFARTVANSEIALDILAKEIAADSARSAAGQTAQGMDVLTVTLAVGRNPLVAHYLLFGSRSASVQHHMIFTG